MKQAILLFPVVCVLLVFPFLHLPIPPYLDFQVIYHADLGLLRGISIYEHAGQVNMIAQLANVKPEQVYVLPFPYPSWYALIALPLALLPIEIGARVWFELSLILLFLSVWLLTDEWTRKKRLSSFIFAFIFVPVLGTLLVGKYGLPVFARRVALGLCYPQTECSADRAGVRLADLQTSSRCVDLIGWSHPSLASP